ncbi:hypothetical protein H0N98_02715 [Candidatus Micrarchaeota archaeon]|nr:hypothetical protein [Candidatus Micrarchaeota archaeon]
MLKVKEENDALCSKGEEHLKEGRYKDAVREFKMAISNDKNFARAELGLAEINLKRLEHTISSLRSVEHVEKKNPLIVKLVERDKEFFYEKGSRESDEAMEYFQAVVELVKKKKDTSELIKIRPNALKECSKGMDRVEQINNWFL